MIKILDKNKKIQAMIKDSYNPWRFEEINGENKLSFNAILTEKVSNYVNENNMVELENEYFNIAYYSKDMNEDGTCTMDVECEHISYRLNDPMYHMDYFTEVGNPTHILSKILEGTGFTIGSVEFTTTLTYSAQEKKSRRQLLMEFVALLGGEVQFDKFSISILDRRGSTDLKIFTKNKNIKVISKIYDGRKDNPSFAYTCTPIILPNKEVGLGDDILLVQPELGIEDTLRVVRYGYNPYEPMEAEIEIANYINRLEDQLYRIETSTVVKEKVYNGIRIGPENGFEAVRSDLRARNVSNATDGFRLQKGDGTGNTWEDILYFDINNQEYIFSGDIIMKGGSISWDTVNSDPATSEARQVAESIADGTYSGGTFIDGSTIYAPFLSGAEIVGGSITSNTTIDVNTNLFVGEYIFLGDQGDYANKGIIFSNKPLESHIEILSNSNMEIFNWNDILIDSENLEMRTFTDINLDSGGTIDLYATDIVLYADTLLDTNTWVGTRTSENLVARKQDIPDTSNLTQPYYSSNYCYVDASSGGLTIRDSNGNILGNLWYD